MKSVYKDFHDNDPCFHLNRKGFTNKLPELKMDFGKKYFLISYIQLSLNCLILIITRN